MVMRFSALRAALLASTKLRPAALLGLLGLAVAAPVMAQSGTWTGTGTDWNTGTNWTPTGVPGAADTATFTNNGAPTALSTSINTSIGTINFLAGAPSYTISTTQAFTVNTTVSNASSFGQTINIGAGTTFSFQASAASGSNVTYNASGFISFRDNAAGGASIFNNMSAIDLDGTAPVVTLGALSGANGTVFRSFTATDTTLAIGGLNTSTTYAGSFSRASTGTISLDKEGTGTLTLSGNNDLAGVTVSAGTLRLGGNSAAGAGTITTLGSIVSYANGVNIANAININSNTTQMEVLAGHLATQSGVISETAGPRPLEKIGDGTLILTATNAYTGVTTITGGTLQIGNGGGTGTISAGNIAIGIGAALSLNRNDAVTLSQVISGGGAVIQAGPGNLTLSGANTYSGGTVLNNGTVTVAAASALGAAGGGLNFDGGTLVTTASFATSRVVSMGFGTANFAPAVGTTLTLNGVVGGIGGLAVGGLGTLVLGADNTYTSFTSIVAGATLQVGAGGITGTLGGGNVLHDGALIFNRSNTLTVANAISGTGTLTQAGTGTTTLTGANTYSGGTTVAAGTLRLGSSGAAGTGTITTTGGALSYANNVTLTNAITLNAASTRFEVLGTDIAQHAAVIGETGGARAFEKTGTGTLILSAENTYTGTTTISAGTLQLGNGVFSAGLGAGAIVNNGALVVNLLGDVTLANTISGTGSLANIAAGRLILSGTNSYQGGTFLRNGTISVAADAGLGDAAGGLTFDGGRLQTTASFTANRPVTLDGSGGSLDAAAGTMLTLTGVVSGTGALTQAGPGALVLTGTNTYSGGTNVNGGTLTLRNTAGAGTGTVTLRGTTLRIDVEGTIANAIVVAAGNNGTISAATGRAVTLTGGMTVRGNSNLILGAPADTGTITARFGVVGTSAPAGTLRIAGGTVINGDGTLAGLADRLTSTTIDAGATLDLAGNTSSAGFAINNLQGAGTLTNTGTTFIRAGNFAGVITGTAGLEKISTGTLILTGANTYSGTTTITAGTLQIGDGGTTGTLGTGAVVNNGVLAFNRSDDITVSNAISGTGQVRQAGTGTTTQLGALSHTGGTFVDAGILVLGNNVTAVNLPGNATVANNAGLHLRNGSLGAGVITLDGGLQVLGNATAGTATINGGLTSQMLFAGDASAGTATILIRNLADFQDNATAGNASITNQCCLVFSGSSTAGNASITTTASGSLDFSGNASAGAATLTNAGFIRFLNNATGGTASYVGQAGSTLDLSFLAASSLTLGSIAGVGNVALGSARLIVGANDASTSFAGVLADGGVIGGTGAALVKAGTGTLTLAGVNTYTGGTTINGGAISIGANAALGAGTGRLTLGGGSLITTASFASARPVTLNFGAGGLAPAAGTALTLSGAITGEGVLRQNGAGNLILTGTSTHTGAVVVNAGTLTVNGSIAASSGVTVNSGGMLGGTGLLPGVTVASGGMLAPGNSIGTIGVASLNLAAGSTTAIEVQGATIDRINVTGAATLGGTLSLAALGGTYQFGTPYTFIQAGSVTGNFAALTTTGSFGAGISPVVSTTATQAQLTLTPGILVPTPTPTPTPDPILPVPPTPTPPPVVSAPAPGLPGFLTSNLRATAAALDNANRAGANLNPFFRVYNQPGSTIGLAVNQLSGEVATTTSAMGFASGEQFLATMLDPLGTGRESVIGGRLRAGDGDGSMPGRKQYAVWGTATGAYNRTTGDATDGTASRTTRTAGFALGFDHRIGAQSMAGIAVAIGESSASVASGQGNATANFGQIGAYGTTRLGSFTFAGAGSFTFMDVDTRRTLFFLGSDQQRAGFNAQVYSLRAQVLQDGVAAGGFRFQPMAAIQWQQVNNQGYTERSFVSGSALGVRVAGQS